MAPRRPRNNDEAVESLIRNPSSKTDFRPIGNQQVITNLMFPAWESNIPILGTSFKATAKLLKRLFLVPKDITSHRYVKV